MVCVKTRIGSDQGDWNWDPVQLVTMWKDRLNKVLGEKTRGSVGEGWGLETVVEDGDWMRS